MSRRILLLSLLHPLPDNPARGIFVADRVRLLRSMGHEVKVVNTLPRMMRVNEQRRSTMQGVATAPELYDYEDEQVLRVRYTAFPEHPFPRWTASSVRRKVSRVERWLGEWRPDLISAHTIWPAAELAERLAKRWSVPWVATVHGHDLQMGLQGNAGRRIRRLCDSATQLVLVSESLRGEMDDAIVIPCHVEVPKSKQQKVEPWHGRWRRGDLEVLFPANARRPEKNHLLALRTGRELETRGWRVNMGDLPNVPRSVVHDRMLACDIALISSSRESGPLVAREAISCGLAVASLDVGDLSTWLPARCIAADATPEALADAVEATLRSDSDDIVVPERFFAEAVSSELNSLFTRLLK